MTNCNYSEHTKMQRKEIQKQIEELQAKLEELENQRPQMTPHKSGDIDIVSYDLKYYYRMGFSSTGHSWWVRGIGHTALIKVDDPETLVKLEQLYEDMILDTGGVVEPKQESEDTVWKSAALRFGEKLGSIGPCGYYEFSPDEWFEWAVNTYEKLADDWVSLLNKEKRVKKLQKKEWTYKITNEHGEVNPYKQHLNPKKSNNLYDVIADWWDEIFMNGNPSGQNIESLVEQIVKLLPDEVNDPSACNDWDIAWNGGYNAYRHILMKKFNRK